jgi:hypothetical protein
MGIPECCQCRGTGPGIVKKVSTVEAKMGLFVKGGISVFLTVINLGFSSRS